MFLLSAVCLLLLLYVILKLFFKGYTHFRCYHNTTYLLCAHGHDKGPSTAVDLELSTLSEIIHVHIAHLHIPITLLPVHETDHNKYYIISGNWFYDFLKMSQPIILLHRNGIIPMHMSLTFEIGLFQQFKLKCIVQGTYLARVVTFQNGYMIPLSRIQVCNSMLPVAPDNTRIAAIASCPDPATTSSGLYPIHAIYHPTELVHNVTQI